MIRVHHLEHSRSQRILWLLEELGRPYEVVAYARGPERMAPPALKEVHPLGKSPVLEDSGTVLAESGAIIEYLVECYGPELAPGTGSPERPTYLYWMHFAEGTLMALFGIRLWVSRIGEPAAPALARVNAQIQEALDLVESALREQPYLAGRRFTAADIQMSYPLQAASARGLLTPGHEAIAAYLQTIESRPSFARSIERGGPFQIIR